jgi:NAD-dependent SIR2 family protein deacetylase
MIKCLSCEFIFDKWKEEKSFDGGTVPVCPKCGENGYCYNWVKVDDLKNK